MLLHYAKLFGENPKEFSSPMDEGDHPELDLTPELDIDGIRLYQSLIGALQWVVTLGRFDVFVGVATMSSFRVAPRQGHLERLKRMYGYLKRQPDGAIRFRVGIPDHESRDTPKQYEWIDSVYGPNEEELPPDMPVPKGKPMRTTCYEDANLLHCLVTGRSMSGVIHLLNQTPIQWFCKKQNVVETATYGSEFMVARQATEQIMDLRYTLRMMGIPLDGPAWMFGDNPSVIMSSTIPHSNLNKRHNALSYHRVREAISAKVLYFIHIDGKLNPSDVMTKFLSWPKFWPLIQPFLFWKGETIKDVHPSTPMTQIVAAIKEQSPSGLRGVTHGNSVSPNSVSPNNVSPSDGTVGEAGTDGVRLNQSREHVRTPPGNIRLPMTKERVRTPPGSVRLPMPIFGVSGTATAEPPNSGHGRVPPGSVRVLMPINGIFDSATAEPHNSDDQGNKITHVITDDQSAGTWITVPSSKSTRKLHSSIKPTKKLQQVAYCTKDLYNHLLEED